MHLRVYSLYVCLFVCSAASNAAAQTAGMGLNPSRFELELRPGQEKTTAFEIESPPSDQAIRGRLLLTTTDWDINENGAIAYVDPNILPDSASSWIVFSPTAVTISSGQTHLVRVTVRVPEGTKPGVYRTGIFVQERPPATPPRKGEHTVYLRFRYVFSLYVIVPAADRAAELVDLRLEEGKVGTQLVCVMTNTGLRHARPFVNWQVKDAIGNVVAGADRAESMVLLGGKKLNQAFQMDKLPDGEYEISAEVDFQDGGAIQSLRRAVRLSTTQQ